MDKNGLRNIVLPTINRNIGAEEHDLWRGMRCVMLEVIKDKPISRLVVLGSDVYWYPDQNDNKHIKVTDQEQLSNIEQLAIVNFERLTTSVLENMVLFGQIYENRFYCLTIVNFENRYLDNRTKVKVLEYCNILPAPVIRKSAYGEGEIRASLNESIYYPEAGEAGAILVMSDPPIRNEGTGEWLINFVAYDSANSGKSGNASDEEVMNYINKTVLDLMESENMARILSVSDLSQISEDQKTKLKKVLVLNAISEVQKVYPEDFNRIGKAKIRKAVKGIVESEVSARL